MCGNAKIKEKAALQPGYFEKLLIFPGGAHFL